MSITTLFSSDQPTYYPEFENKLYEFVDLTHDFNLLKQFTAEDFKNRILNLIPFWARPIKNEDDSNLVKLLYSISDNKYQIDNGLKEEDDLGGFMYLYDLIKKTFNKTLLGTATGEDLDFLVYDMLFLYRYEDETDEQLRFRAYEVLFDYIPQYNGFRRLYEKHFGNDVGTYGHYILSNINPIIGPEEYGFIDGYSMFCLPEFEDITEYKKYQVVNIDEDERTIRYPNVNQSILANGIIVDIYDNNHYNVQFGDYITDNTWNYNIGQDIYYDDNYELTTNDFGLSRKVGTMVTPNTLFVNFTNDISTNYSPNGVTFDHFSGKIGNTGVIYILVPYATRYGAIFTNFPDYTAYFNTYNNSFFNSDTFLGDNSPLDLLGIIPGSILDKFIQDTQYTKAHGIQVIYELFPENIIYTEEIEDYVDPEEPVEEDDDFPEVSIVTLDMVVDTEDPVKYYYLDYVGIDEYPYRDSNVVDMVYDIDGEQFVINNTINNTRYFTLVDDEGVLTYKNTFDFVNTDQEVDIERFDDKIWVTGRPWNNVANYYDLVTETVDSEYTFDTFTFVNSILYWEYNGELYCAGYTSQVDGLYVSKRVSAGNWIIIDSIYEYIPDVKTAQRFGDDIYFFTSWSSSNPTSKVFKYDHTTETISLFEQYNHEGHNTYEIVSSVVVDGVMYWLAIDNFYNNGDHYLRSYDGVTVQDIDTSDIIDFNNLTDRSHLSGLNDKLILCDGTDNNQSTNGHKFYWTNNPDNVLSTWYELTIDDPVISDWNNTSYVNTMLGLDTKNDFRFLSELSNSIREMVMVVIPEDEMENRSVLLDGGV